jgi:hypothetical protein
LDQKDIHTYEGCTDFEIECNFELELSASITPTTAGSELSSKWSAWIDGDTIVPATMGGSPEKRTVCAKVTEAGIVNADPSKELHVADVTILARPTAAIVPCYGE